MPDQARAAARAAESQIASGDWRGPLHGVPIGLKDLFDVAGVPCTMGSEILRDRVPCGRCHGHRAPEVGGRGHSGQAQPARVRVRHQQREPALRAGAQPVGHGTRPGWLERRNRGGGGRRLVRGWPGQRHRSVDSSAGQLVWHRRLEADVRARQPRRGPAAGVVARPCRPARAQRCRLRADAAGNRRRRPTRPLGVARAGTRLFGGPGAWRGRPAARRAA